MANFGVILPTTNTKQTPRELVDFAVRAEDLGYDSLALLDILAQIENKYDLKLSEDYLDQMQTPGQLIEFVNNMLIGAR